MEEILKIQRFRTKEAAKRYAKGAGLKGYQVRMIRDKNHPWANKRGNVPVLFAGRKVDGDNYFFDDGYTRPKEFEGLPRY